jgi:uncharacterized protein (DUF427 family)
MKAVWKGTVIADSQGTVVVEGNHYFTLASVNASLLEPSTQPVFVHGRARRIIIH